MALPGLLTFGHVCGGGSPRSGSPLTLDIQLGSVLGEALQADLLADQGEELLKGRAGLLVVVHLLLRALASLTVKDAHFVFPAELQRQERLYAGRPGRDVRGDGTERALSGRELLGSHRNLVPQPERKEKSVGPGAGCPSASLPFQRGTTRPTLPILFFLQRARPLPRGRDCCLG